MAIKRYFADADNTITNAYKEDFNTRGTGSNMGQSDILEIFSLYAQQSSNSSELARSLIKFPVTSISADRAAGSIGASGSVSFYLNLYNAEHTKTLPRDFYITVAAISGSWEEGNGLDMENYTDITHDEIGSNWIRNTGSNSWKNEGGDWYTNNENFILKQRFLVGNENLSLNVTEFVEQWIDSDGIDNNGFIVMLSASYEASSVYNSTGSTKSYYTKKFFARSSEFFFDRPTLEARWDSSRRDNRGNFYLSSSIAPASENLNTLYLYNYIRGNLRDIAGVNSNLPSLTLYHSSGSVPEGNKLHFINSSLSSVNTIEATRVSTGVYKAQFSVSSSTVTNTYPNLVDVWTYGGSQIHTGSAIIPKKYSFSDINPNGSYVISMPGLKKSYATNTTERFRLYVRNKNWSPSIYSKSKSTPETLLIESASYQITRLSDQRVVVPFGTGSQNHTLLSYDSSGNYFDLDIDLLESGYSYGIRYSFYEDSVNSYREHPYTFKFKVSQNEQND